MTDTERLDWIERTGPEIDAPPNQPDAKDVVRWLCRLQAHVHSAIGYGTAADCFCGEGGFWPKADDPPGYDRQYDGTHFRGYRNDGVVLQFIADAVREKLARPSPEAIDAVMESLVGEVERLRRENERPLWMLVALLRAAGGELSCSTADMQEVGSRDEIVRIDGEGVVTFRLAAATHA